ncbi:bile acid:sodium symporter family protein [Microbulbifer yueqingensis]|uniref:Bile acid:Na+ symporter, BASS family n=1 Tax=Microbulbifer yueqingensis TaxID=658219 RepID=A0A1G8Z8P6_9GAMM|nr:bile acid:sodium symporter family protein [Microbulbifer yueqingensis]SDK11466.1 bile acid:Na+ symporter, BASS family [Microbulbifer yueqingensis]
MVSSVFSQLVLPICLFVIMFGMGLALTPGDFTRVARYPRAAFLGTFGQMVMLPLAGFAIAFLLMPTPALAVGLVLLAACPGGTTSNLVAYLARADLALSISLTAISSVLTIFTIPLIAALALAAFTDTQSAVAIPAERMIKILMLITLLPVGLGMLLRAHALRLARWLEPKINLFGALFLVFLIVVIIAQQGEGFIGQLRSSGPATLLLNGSMVVAGYLTARLAHLNADQATSITIEIGIQNSTMAILVATTLLQAPAMAVPAAVYSLVMYVSGGIIVGIRRWQLRQRALPQVATQ